MVKLTVVPVIPLALSAAMRIDHECKAILPEVPAVRHADVNEHGNL